MDGEEDRAADAGEESLELALEAALVGGVPEAGQDGAAADDLHLLRHEELAHRPVGADGILELHPLDGDAERCQEPHVLLVGAQHEIGIERPPVAEQEEIRVLLEEGVALPGGIRPDETDGAQPAEAHGAPPSAPDLLVLVEIVVLMEPEQARGPAGLVVRVAVERLGVQAIENAWVRARHVDSPWGARPRHQAFND